MQDESGFGKLNNIHEYQNKNQLTTGVKSKRIFPRTKKFAMKRDKDGRIRLLKQTQANFFHVAHNGQESIPTFQFKWF